MPDLGAGGITPSHFWPVVLEPFWIPGLVLLVVLAGAALLLNPWSLVRGKNAEWVLYVLAGTVLPAVLFGTPWLWRRRGWSATSMKRVHWWLAAGFVIALALFALSRLVSGEWARVASAAGLAALLALLLSQPWRSPGLRWNRFIPPWIAGFASWLALIPGSATIEPGYPGGFAVAFLLTAFAVGAAWNGRDATPGPIWTRRGTNLLALAAVAFMSFRTEHLFSARNEVLGLQHWSAWTGPAELVQQGGWLLWDVPAMYGLLTTTVLAFVPGASPWQALYLLMSLSFFVMGAGIFLIVRSIRPGWLNWLFALALAIAIPVFARGLRPFGTPADSTLIFPNHAAQRYLWCFLILIALIALLVHAERPNVRRALLLVGSSCWLAGVFWSAESAFYCSVAWLPAYAIVTWQATSGRPNRVVVWARWLAGLALALMICVALVWGSYSFGLGHGPDPRAFVDFVFGIGSGVLVTANDPAGISVLGLLLAGCLTLMAVWYFGCPGGKPGPRLGPWIGIAGLFWATGVYSYTRAYPNQSAFVYAIAAVILAAIARQRSRPVWTMVAAPMAAALLTMALAAPFGAIVANPLAAREAISAYGKLASAGFRFDALLPSAPVDLQALMAEAGVRPDDPISFQGSWFGNLMLPWHPANDPDKPRVMISRDWLPAHGYVQFQFLPAGRGQLYAQRFIDQFQLSGWLIQAKTGPGPGAGFPMDVAGRYPWLFDILQDRFQPTRFLQNENWQITWFDYTGGQSRAVSVQPVFRRGVLETLPPDIRLNGVPLAETTNPGVWTIFGPGWGDLDEATGTRVARSGATLFVYSPRSETVDFRVSLGPVEGGALARVHSPEMKHSEFMAPNETRAMALPLSEGWNRVMFTVTGADGEDRADGEGSMTIAGIEIAT